MAGGEYRLEGGRKLRATLKAAGDDLSDLKKANRDAADIAAKASAALAPVKSGKLKRTIRAAGTKTAGIIRAGTKAVPYAQSVHWGRLWWPNKLGTPRHISRVGPQPFLSDGATSSEGRWLPIYEKQLEEIISRIEGANP